MASDPLLNKQPIMFGIFARVLDHTEFPPSRVTIATEPTPMTPVAQRRESVSLDILLPAPHMSASSYTGPNKFHPGKTHGIADWCPLSVLPYFDMVAA